MKYNYLIIGLALQVGAIAMAYVSNRILYAIAWLFILVVCFPVFFVSPFYLMRTGLPLVIRLILSFWILAFPIYWSALLIYDWNRVPTEVFLIPDGYRGLVTVILDQPDGVPVEHEGKKFIFRVGADGKLKTQMRQPTFSNTECVDALFNQREYYWINASGAKVKLNYPTPLDGDALAPDQVIITQVPGPAETQNLNAIHLLIGTISDFRKYLDGLK